MRHLEPDETTVRLYEIPKGSKIKATLEDGKEALLTFHHIDGAYSYITVDGGSKEDVIHLSASTMLEKVGDYYEIVENTD